MAEEKQEKKKAGIIWRILKWIGLAIPTILLILAILFFPSWKVTILFFIILAACVIPKKMRKWFWLSVAAIVIALIIWIFLPDDDEGWRPYTFEKELAAIEAQYTVPDEENAAKIYDELFGTMNGDPNEPKFFLRSRPSSKDEPWLSKDHPETAEWLKGYESTIEKLLQSAKKDKCHFHIPAYSWDLDQDMERLPKMRRCTFLLLSAANNDIAEGRIDAGLEKYLCIIRMAKYLYQQPVIIDFLVGFAIEGLALSQLNRFVIEGQPNGEQLELIGNTIKGLKNNWSSDWPKILDLEKLHSKNTLCSSTYQVNPQGKVRLSRDPCAGMKEQWQEELKVGKIQDSEAIATLQRLLYPTYLQRKRCKAKTILSWFFMPSTPQKAAKIIDGSYERYYAMTGPNFNWQKEPKEYPITSLFSFTFLYNYRRKIERIADISGPVYYKIHEIYVRNLSLRRGSRLLTAIKQYNIEHGSWPENLEQVKGSVPAEVLVDPITGDAFVYKLIEEDFMLYSRGKNGIDEGGIRREVVDPNAAREPVDPNFFKEILELESEFFGETSDPNVLKQMYDPNDYRPTKTVGDDVLIWPPRSRKTKDQETDV
ncbi:MAG: hypothetical protein ACETVZ_09585 [Phycisphaerae bacterium]